jgi:hypothetical protein
MTAPSRSVRKTLAPARASRCTTSGDGCPKTFCRPTLMTAATGA